jgi:hypothetical protein
MRMKYENSDTCLQQLCMRFISKPPKTAQISELFDHPSLFTLHWPPLMSLAVIMESRDRVISPTPVISPRFNLLLRLPILQLEVT